ncbi:MAG TPA: DUF2007 domain-containing protein [Gammaproteobacteria bacterium]|nr:DUF2007 domain-containing protein [Gammaproteobacteria bacterium]
MIVAGFVRLSASLIRFGNWCRESGLRLATDDVDAELSCPDLDLQPEMDELVTVATYDQSLDAHIALGRLAAEGIQAMLFDDQMVQMDWLYSIALGGIKLRVAQSDADAARQVLETDYSHDLDDIDLGKPEN